MVDHSAKKAETTDEKTPKSASISNVWVDHNVIVNGRKGMRIHVQFSVKNMLYCTGKVAIYFYKNDAKSAWDKYKTQMNYAKNADEKAAMYLKYAREALRQ